MNTKNTTQKINTETQNICISGEDNSLLITHSNIRNEVPPWESNETRYHFFCDYLSVRIMIKNQGNYFGTIQSTTSADSDDIIKEKELSQNVIVSNGYEKRNVYVKSLRYSELEDKVTMPASQQNITSNEVLMERYGMGITNSNDNDIVAIDISGNPTTFFQNHNVWGSKDMKEVILDYLKTILVELQLWAVMSEAEQKNVNELNIICRRFDLATNLKAKSRTEKGLILNGLLHQSKASRLLKAYFDTTIYFGQRTNYRVSFYDKEKEVKAKSKKGRKPNTHSCENIIRFEISLGRQWFLTNKPSRLKNLILGINDSNKSYDFFLKHIKGINFGQVTHSGETLEQKMNVLRSKVESKSRVDEGNGRSHPYTQNHINYFQLWLNNVGPNFSSKGTFYRVRKDLLNLIDIDISCPKTGDAKATMSLKKLILSRLSCPSKEWAETIYNT